MTFWQTLFYITFFVGYSLLAIAIWNVTKYCKDNYAVFKKSLIDNYRSERIRHTQIIEDWKRRILHEK